MSDYNYSYGEIKNVKDRVTLEAEEPDDDLVEMSLESSDSFITSYLQSNDITNVSDKVKELDRIAELYAVAEILLVMFNVSPDQPHKSKIYFEEAKERMERFVDSKKVKKNISPYSHSFTPKKPREFLY